MGVFTVLDTSKVKVLEKQNLYKKFFSADEYKLTYPLYNGGMSPVVTREIISHEGAAAVLLYDPVADKVALIEQFRFGIYVNGEYPWTIECVAGMDDHAGENLIDLANRECMEEAGAKITELEKITRYYSSPGGSNEIITLYCGKTDISNLPKYAGLESENEDIKINVYSIEQVEKMLQNGQLNNAMVIIAVQWLLLNRVQLRKKWGAS